MPRTHNNIDHFENNDLLPRSYQEDIIEEEYKIHADRSVNELSNQFCRYYFATHLKSEKEYFAIVFERNFNPDIHAIELLKKHPISSCNKIVAYSLVKLSTSRKYQFVAIVESYDPSDTLQHYIETNGSMAVGKIQTELLPALIKTVEYCASHEINCSNINPTNIIVTKNNTFILREFISTAPNFYQPLSYLAPELGDTNDFGRLKTGVAADIYALGMTTYFALTGFIPNFGKHNPRVANANRIEEGSYNTIAIQAKIPKIFKEFLAATLSDNPIERCDITELCAEFLSQSNKKTRGSKNSYNINHTILFEGHNYSNPVALASAMYTNYEAGLKFFKEENFIKWVQRTKNKNIEEFIPFINNNSAYLENIDNMEEKMLRAFAILDYSSPLKIKDLSITVETIPNLLFTAVYNDNKHLLEHISHILTRQYWKIVLSPEYKTSLPNGYMEVLTSISNAFRLGTPEYTSKQQLYLLDPYIPCLSLAVIGDYVLSIGDLLVALDRIAAHTPNKIHIDEHIAAFIYSRLKNTSSEDEKLDNIPEHLSKSIMLRGVFWLAMAQDNAMNIKVPHLCSILAQKLIEWINDNLHSSKLKKVITSEIAELSTTGSLSQMLYVISNPQLFYNDYRGFKVAHKQVLDLEKEIKYLSNEEQMYSMGLCLGQRLTVLFSYFLCMLVSLVLVI